MDLKMKNIEVKGTLPAYTYTNIQRARSLALWFMVRIRPNYGYEAVRRHAVRAMHEQRMRARTKNGKNP